MNLASIIEAHPADRVAIIRGDSLITYGELRSDVARARTDLSGAGVTQAHRVAVCTHDAYAFLCGLFATWGVGACAVPLNPQAPDAELRREVDEAQPTHLWGEARDVTIDVVPTWRASAPSPVPLLDLDADALALAIFTSGTAGPPTPAALTHRNVLANLAQVRAHASGAAAVGAGDTVLCAVPLFHIFGLSAIACATLAAGAQLVLFDRFDPQAALDAATRHHITLIPGVPAMWNALLHFPGDPRALASVRLAGSGAAHLPLALREAVRDRFGVEIQEGYGLTETSPVVCLAAGTGAPAGSIGRPVPGVELRLVDDAGADVLAGDEGEVWVRGSNVGRYLDRGAQARAFTPDGWLRTGDAAIVDDRGFLTVVDRRKDLIIVSGFNVYPTEVEDVLLEHPQVLEAAVSGEPDARTGEAVHAYVVASGPLEAQGLSEFCARSLAHYKCPTAIDFVDALPRVATGKVRRPPRE